jgi:predicted nucleic acid-binding protein
MITALDTNILVDLVQGREKVIDAIAKSSAQGQLIIGEIVYAEMCAGMDFDQVESLCKDFGIELVYSSRRALSLAGQIWRHYRAHHAGSMKNRVLADFMVAAHALTHANRLVTHDRDFYRNYFKNLVLLST